MTFPRSRIFLTAITLLAIGLHNTSATPKRYNVLFISVDDQNNDIASFGTPEVITPNIDRLAREGVAFQNAYCQFPLCGPSRNSILSGLRPDSIRAFDLAAHFRQEIPDHVSLPQLFIQNNYYVARVGKLYHVNNPGDIGKNGLDDRLSWIERFNPVGIDHTELEAKVVNYTSFLNRKKLGAAMAWHSDNIYDDKDHTDGKVATKTIELLNKHKDEPFFIAAGFFRPHTPWIAPKKYFDLYPIEEIEIQERDLKQIDKNYPKLATAMHGPWPNFGITDEQARYCKRAYYASTSFVDAQIGRLLNALDHLGLRDNTIVVFWSDHGYHLGEHGLWFKKTCFEESTKSPLIISLPNAIGNGKPSSRIVEFLDIYPTIADLAGLSPPESIQGVSLRKLIENPDANWNRPAFSQVLRINRTGRTVRTKKWRYTEWHFGELGQELYDHDHDPSEMENLAQDPSYAETITLLQAMLNQNFTKDIPRREYDPSVKKRYTD